MKNTYSFYCSLALVAFLFTFTACQKNVSGTFSKENPVHAEKAVTADISINDGGECPDTVVTQYEEMLHKSCKISAAAEDIQKCSDDLTGFLEEYNKISCVYIDYEGIKRYIFAESLKELLKQVNYTLDDTNNLYEQENLHNALEIIQDL